MSAPAVLVVFPQCLDWWGHGNMQRVVSMGRYLSGQGLDVDLVYQGNPRVPSREFGLTGFRRVVRVAGWNSWLESIIDDQRETFFGNREVPGRQLAPSPALCGLVRSLLDGLEYAAVISTYAWTATIYETLAHSVLRILDVQDITFLHGEGCQSATGQSTPFALDEDTERFLWSQWDALLAITAEEASMIRPSLSPAQRLLVVGHAASATATTAAPGSGGVVYTGSDNFSNVSSLRWFLKEAWPLVLAAEPRARLDVAGLVCERIRDEAGALPGVRLLGFLEDVTDLVHGAEVIVAPYLFGSGLKIKVVEAAAAGKAIVTTAPGAVGTGLIDGRSIRIADAPNTFARRVIELLRSRDHRTRLGAAALEHVRRHMSEAACYGPVADLIRSAPAPSRTRSGGFGSIVRRIDRARRALDARRLVIWGDGSHTRQLIEALSHVGVRPECIVDGRGASRAISEEEIPVLPKQGYAAAPDDLIVLSSEPFEHEMWNDLAALRAEGAHVLGLYRPGLVTPQLRARMLATLGATSV